VSIFNFKYHKRQQESNLFVKIYVILSDNLLWIYVILRDNLLSIYVILRDNLLSIYVILRDNLLWILIYYILIFNSEYIIHL